MKKIVIVAILISTILFSSCYNEEDYALSKLPDDIIEITFLSDSIIADGETFVDITIDVPLKTKTESAKIKLTTTNGTFENDKMEIEVLATFSVVDGIDKKNATVRLTSSQKMEDAIIEAKIGDLSKSRKLIFNRAYAEEIRTELGSLTISYGYQTTSIITKLSRIKGKPSINTIADVKVIDSLGNELGQFLNFNNKVDENGDLTNQFSLGIDSCSCSRIYAISKTLMDELTEISDTTSLIIKTN